MHPARLFLALIAIGLAGGCSTTRSPQLYLSHFDIKNPQVDDFETCASSGCREISRLAYSEAEWQSICDLFKPAPTNAEEERGRIRIALAAMETIIGEKNGTSADCPMNRRGNARTGQLDCIAEATNTTVALILLAQDGLLHYHTVGYPAHRGFLQLKLPHNTATIYEKETGEQYTVDTWFFANGEQPVTVPVSAWKTDYSPFKENPYHEPVHLPETP